MLLTSEPGLLGRIPHRLIRRVSAGVLQRKHLPCRQLLGQGARWRLDAAGAWHPARILQQLLLLCASRVWGLAMCLLVGNTRKHCLSDCRSSSSARCCGGQVYRFAILLYTTIKKCGERLGHAFGHRIGDEGGTSTTVFMSRYNARQRKLKSSKGRRSYPSRLMSHGSRP